MTTNSNLWGPATGLPTLEHIDRRQAEIRRYGAKTVPSIHHLQNAKATVDRGDAIKYGSYIRAAEKGDNKRAAELLDELKYSIYERRTDLDFEERARRFSKVCGFNIKSANETVSSAAVEPDPRALYAPFWYEGEISVLYADTNIGKSIFAVQIADHISRCGKRVLYVDLELSDKGFEMRCRNPKTGSRYEFSPNFYRMTLDKMTFRQMNGTENVGTKMLDNIVNIALELEADCIIIDNLTALAESPNSASTAIDIVTRLVQIKENTTLSVLLVAHTPKMKKNEPITRDAIAGSKMLINLVDSAFAIGAMLANPKIRYIKQTKVRTGRFTYAEDNVIVSEIENRGGLLQFVFNGNKTESEMLMTLTEVKRKATYDKIAKLKKDGFTVEETCEVMRMSAQAVKKILNEMGLNHD